MLYKIMMPDYVHSFKCIADACPATCCKGWRIDVDPKTYKKYQKCKDEQWRTKLLDNVLKQENSDNYTVKYKEEGYCFFIDDNQMCSIQKHFGEDYLSYTCRIFPRKYNIMNNILMKSCFLSCPEITRAVLLSGKKNKLILVSEKITETVSQIIPCGKYAKRLGIIRDFILSILQKENYSINEKMLILAYFFESFRADNLIDVKQLIATFNELVDSQQIKAIFEQINSDRVLHVNIMQKIMNAIFNFSNNKRFNDNCQDFYYMLKLNENAGSEYFKLYNSDLHKLVLQKYPHIIENYMGHSIFFNWFADTDDLWKAYFLILLRYALFDVFLLGYTIKYNGSFVEKDFIVEFANFSRAVDSAFPSVLENAYNILLETNCIDMKYVFAILKT